MNTHSSLAALLIILLAGILPLSAKEIARTPNPELQHRKWSARWIAPPNRELNSYGVFMFRKSITLTEVPAEYVVNISADNRYRLYVNGKSVCFGPARGDIKHWFYETVNLSSFLQPGKNTLAVVVWNFGDWMPGAQMSYQTGLIVQANSELEKEINTNNTWLVEECKAYSPILEGRHDIGCGELVDGAHYPWGWTEPTFDDSAWKKAAPSTPGEPYGITTGCTRFLLPRDIPLMEESPKRLTEVRAATGATVQNAFLQGNEPFTVPANTKATILLDQNHLTTAYPELTVSNGKGSKITLLYAEALYDDKHQKGNRNEVANRKNVNAHKDCFVADGGANRSYRPLWFKTYRYITLEIETGSEPLLVNDLKGEYTGYPFQENGYFQSGNAEIDKVWEVGWRTARLCAHETYFDCPYYEQLQYVGDTRIQALISLYVDGDDRLARRAIKFFDWSRSFEGITTSRYPSHIEQYIPPFSLLWVNMVKDYYDYRSDHAFITSCIPGVKTVLDWYIQRIDPKTGILGYTPHWNFVDWGKPWPWDSELPLGGVPPGGRDGGSSVTSLQLAMALDDASALLRRYNDPHNATRYSHIARNIKRSVYKQCWNEEKQLMQDDIKATSYSQHASILGILSDAVPANRQRALYNRIVDNPEVVEATFYFRYYLIRAMKKVGESEQYIAQLKPWHDMIDIGLTTFAENPEPSRSDCHAWSSSPNYDLLATVCGIEPASPGFNSVRIQPSLGTLNWVKGRVPHPLGFIDVEFHKKGDKLTGVVTLPKGLTGTYTYKGVDLTLKEGKNKI